jgi:hypothetical protein
VRRFRNRLTGLRQRWLHGSVGDDEIRQQGQHLGFNAVHRFRCLPFKAQHQNWRGVGGSNQAETIWPIDAQAIDV